MTLWNKRNFGPPNPPTKTWVLLSGLVNSLHDECQCGWYFLGQKRNKKTLAGGFKAFFNFAALWKWSKLTCAYFFQMGWFNPPLETLGKAMDSRVFFFDDLFDSQVAEFWVRVFFGWGVKVSRCAKKRRREIKIFKQDEMIIDDF